MTKPTMRRTGVNAIERRELLKYACGGAGLSAVGLMSNGCAQAPPVVQRRDPPELSEFPTLSPNERDRRWDTARQLMQENNVRCLLVLAPGADNFFTNDVASTIIFPLDDEPVAITRSASFAGNLLKDEERGNASWVTDWRFRTGGPAIVEILKEKGLANSRIGTIGATGGGNFAPSGHATYAFWTHLTEALPQATFVELFEQFISHWLTKSEEDLAVFRKASTLSEVASEAALEVTKPGVSEIEIFSAIQCEILRHGGRTSNLILHSGPDNAGWGAPKWQFRAQRPPVIQEGDIICTELFPHYGHLQAQAQMCIAVGQVADVNHTLARLARESYEIGLQVIRPGVKFIDVAREMNKPNEREGAWHLTPNIHSLNPLHCVGPVTEGIENFEALGERFNSLPQRGSHGDEIVLQAGMTFQLEPNSSFDRNRVNIGGNVIVTEDGCEELNSLPCEMRFVG